MPVVYGAPQVAAHRQPTATTPGRRCLSRAKSSQAPLRRFAGRVLERVRRRVVSWPRRRKVTACLVQEEACEETARSQA